MRLHLKPHDSGEIARTDPAEPGTRVDFDGHGRPLVLEIAVDRPVRVGRVDRVLAALGEEPLNERERAALARDEGRADRRGRADGP